MLVSYWRVSLFAAAAAAIASSQSFAQDDDRLVVPGARIGPVRLGMSERDLYRAMGDATSTTDLGRGWLWYRYDSSGAPGFLIKVNPQGHVSEITVSRAGYRTDGGVGVGASQLAIRANLGPPARRKGDSQTEAWCYPSGLMVGVTARGIGALTVMDPSQWADECK